MRIHSQRSTKKAKAGARPPVTTWHRRRRWRAPAGGTGGGLPGLPPSTLDSSGPGPTSELYDGDTVHTVLANTLGRLMQPIDFQKRTIIADTRYCAVTPGFVLHSILTDPVLSSPQTYQPDLFDCDDYVQYLKTKMSLYAAAQLLPAPLAVGYLFTTLHAFSFCLGGGAEPFLINTQSANHAVLNDATLYPLFLSLTDDNPITCVYL